MIPRTPRNVHAAEDADATAIGIVLNKTIMTVIKGRKIKVHAISRIAEVIREKGKGTKTGIGTNTAAISQESLPKKGFLHPSFPALKASLVLKKRNPKNNTVIEARANVVLDVAKTTTRATALRDRGTSRVETNSM